MSNEVRVQAEGSLWWVQGSGTGKTWATASAPASGLIGFCTDFTFSSGLKSVQIKERGRVDHHKITEWDAIDLGFSFLWTGAQMSPVTASGASVPHMHLEFKALRPEDFSGSGYYYQFYGALLEKIDFSEKGDGDSIKLGYKALGMSGANTSGYLK